jgi:hypothetical protein
MSNVTFSRDEINASVVILETTKATFKVVVDSETYANADTFEAAVNLAYAAFDEMQAADKHDLRRVLFNDGEQFVDVARN